MACEITAVNDDLDDATIAFIEKHASILDEEDPFLCFIDELDDHRAIFRSMDQLSRLSFTSTMIPEFGKLFGYLVASEKRIPSTKLLQRISLSILRLPASPLLYREYRWRPRSRPTCGFGEPVHCFAAIRPVSKVTEHCQTASRKSDRTLHRPLSCPSAWRWYESATARASCHAEGASLCPTDLGLKGQGGSSARGTGRAAEAGLWMVDPPTTRPDVRVPHQYQMVHGDADAQRPRSPNVRELCSFRFNLLSRCSVFSLIYLLDPPYSLVPSPPVLFYLSLSP
ncbi:hypothetical protein PAPYR_11940 [Paratrimastix pyriformis]|uniref:Uncharacterized protein n=1 Tax=Paratrimastix pyriformis TaxID=342808 RepID=A0ABQ8U891_9EUKA|nr:hypothetical protein PAPYR_11940 [Paratrimastix pyriformis]